MNRLLITACCALALTLVGCSNDPEPKRPDTGPQVKPPQDYIDLEKTKDAGVDAANKVKEAGKDAAKALDGAAGK